MMPRQPILRAFLAFWIAVAAALSPAGDANASFQGLWYRGEAESGWGVNVAHQGDILFVTWFTYDTDGRAMWLVGSNFTKTTGNTYAGTLFRTTGARFDDYSAAPFAFTAVGTGTLSFADTNNATFTYTVNGVTQMKPIVRQLFSATPPICALGGAPGATTNFSDLWWAGPEQNGWGVNLTHQDNILFATWFTYDSTGRGMWIVGPRLEKGFSGNTFSGPLYRVTGPPFSANPWDPAGTAITPVGTATFTFTDASNGTFTYTVDNVNQGKRITRQVFATPTTVCATPSQPPPSTQAPRLVATWPLNGRADASALVPVTATFSEPMDPATINASTFTLAGPTGAVGATVSYSGITATLTPSARLAAQTQYTATLSTGVRDLSGTALTGSRSIIFTTRADEPPLTAQVPQVVATWPPDTGLQGSAVLPVTATFSEPMDPATINASTFALTGPTGPVAATVSYSGITATLTPSARLITETQYSGTLTTGARDASGTPLATNYSFVFTTRADEPPPIVAGCPTPAGTSQLRRLEWGATPILRQASGAVTSYRVPLSQIGRASVSFTQGQASPSPPGPTVELTVSRCPGVIEDVLHPSCRIKTTFANFVSITAFNRPLAESGRHTQEDHAALGCLAPADSEQHYVNVRWTFASCPFGVDQCGFSVQWGEGSY